MPTRILREGIIHSEKINALSERAELFYRRLMSIVDDYGRFYAHPASLRASCYPLRLQSVSEADVKQMLSECVRHGIITLYGGGKYLLLGNFKQQTRSKSKFPAPEPVQLTADGMLNICLADDVQPDKQMISLDGVVVGVEDGYGPDPKKAKPSCPEESVAYCLSIGLQEVDGRWFWDRCEGSGWKNNGRAIRDWKATIRAWQARDYLPSQKSLGRNKGPNI